MTSRRKSLKQPIEFPSSNTDFGRSCIQEGSAEKLILLIQSWIEDPSDHDEKIWPMLERDLADTRN
jgi:hypothetical protein